MAMLRTKSTLLALTCATLGLASGCEIFLGQVLVGSGIPVTKFERPNPFLEWTSVAPSMPR